MRGRWRLVLTMVLLASALAGCAPSNASATGTAEGYFHDLGSGDYQGACQLLTDELRGRLGDCPAALRRHVAELPVGELRELREVTVAHVVYHGKDTALVYPQDVKAYVTVTVRVNGSPAPRSSAARSIAAYHATDGHTLRLTRAGRVWRIADGA
jgi:hypothetical protein